MLKTVSFYLKTIGLYGLFLALKGKLLKKQYLLKKNHPSVLHPFFLRVPSSDVPTFAQIFIENEYEFNVLNNPETIIDAGANVGLAAIYFANKYPTAKIYSIEPEGANFQTLKINVSPYKNITPIQAALWNTDGEINLTNPGLGSWGFITEENDENKRATKNFTADFFQKVPSFTMDTILANNNLQQVDILKIDIEGAEKEVFENSTSWISKIETVIVETHDYLKPGTHQSYMNGTPGFKEEWKQGENNFKTKGNVIRKDR